MSKDILKDAAFEAMKREIQQIPAEEELAVKYPLSRQLTEKLQLIINEYNYKYRMVMGRQVPRKLVSGGGMLVIIAVLAWMYSNNVIDRQLLKSFIRLSVISLIAILFPRRRKQPKQERNFKRMVTGQYQPALMDVEDPLGRYNEYNEYGYEFDYDLPGPPAGFTIRDEVRMAARHLAVFDNGRGIVINYAKIALRNGIPYTVDTKKVRYESLTVNENDAIRFVIDGVNHLIWEDFSCQYHLYGNGDMKLLQQIAESMV